ncbi:MAG: right-handed parallel beta-helix repeat-containing protein [Deltaproteobacteria bacterium]|nr:right-handed parallel beta-helix repeat-containing protein [Deltaproteobacteria bacterium]
MMKIKVAFISIIIFVFIVLTISYQSDKLMFGAVQVLDQLTKSKFNLQILRDKLMLSIDEMNPINLFFLSDDLPVFKLQLSTSDLLYLESINEKADIEGLSHVSDYDNTFRKAKLYYENKEYKVKVKFHGSNRHHVKSPKKSLRIKLLAANSIGGVTDFSLIIPEESGIVDLVYYNLLKKFYAFEVKSFFCHLEINGVDLGIYFFEEKLDQVLLEKNGFSGVDILKPKSEWFDQYLHHTGPFVWDISYQNFKDLSKMDVGQLLRYKRLYSGLVSKNETPRLIDLDWFAKIDALRIVFGSDRPFAGDNQRLLYSTSTGKFLPFVRVEGVVEKLESNKNALNVFEQSMSHLRINSIRDDYVYQKNYQNDMYLNLVKNDDYRMLRNRYLYELLRQQEDMLRVYDDIYEKSIEHITTDTSNNFPARYYSLLGRRYRENFSYNFDFIKKYFDYSRAFTEVEQVKPDTYLLKIRPDSNVPIQVEKLELLLDSPAKLLVTRLSDGSSQLFESKTVTVEGDTIHNQFSVDAFPFFKNDRFLLGLTDHLEILKREYVYELKSEPPFKIKNITIQFKNSFNNKVLNERVTYSVIINKPELFEFEYLTKKPLEFLNEFKELNLKLHENTIILPTGEYSISKNIILPYGVNLVIEKGSKIALAHDKSIIVYGSLTINGEKENPVVISNLEKNKPFGVIAAIGDLNNNIHIDHLSLSGGHEAIINGSYLSGGLSLYGHGLVKINNSSITGNTADDGLNIKNAKVDIRNSVFSSNFADQIDLDNCEGIVVGNKFSKGDSIAVSSDNNGDGLDLSGSKFLIVNNTFDGFVDKGVSIGEKSLAFVKSNNFNNNRSAVTIKDQSEVYLESNIYNQNTIWVEEYQKKYFFDFPVVYNFGENIPDNKVVTKGDSKYVKLNKKTPFKDGDFSIKFDFDLLKNLIH